MNWKTVIRVGGAYLAYQVGAGFATGQEAVQYFASYGGWYPIILPLFCAVIMAVYCSSHYRMGFSSSFSNPNEVYESYCGKYPGKVMAVFSNVVIALTGLLMFAGSGATLNQYWGLPVWVGALLMGVLSAFVVCLGLEKVTTVLGSCGIFIIVVVIFAGLYNVVTADVSMMEAQANMASYVASGRFLQISVFGSTNPFLVTFSYATMALILVVPYNVAMGSSECRSKKECIASGIVATVFFTMALIAVIFSIVYNLDYIASKDGNIYIMSAIENSLPWLKLPYTLLITCGIFTTITGYLWSVGRWVAPDGTNKQRIVVILMALIGITVGSVIPLDKLVNIILPIAGYVGMVLFVFIIIAEAKALIKKPTAN